MQGSFSRTDSASGFASSWSYGFSMSVMTSAVFGIRVSYWVSLACEIESIRQGLPAATQRRFTENENFSSELWATTFAVRWSIRLDLMIVTRSPLKPLAFFTQLACAVLRGPLKSPYTLRRAFVVMRSQADGSCAAAKRVTTERAWPRSAFSLAL